MLGQIIHLEIYNWEEDKENREKTWEFTWLGLMAYIHTTRDQSATFSHILFLIVHCNEIHIYNGIYTKVNDNLNFELDIDCHNPIIFSRNQSLDLLTNPKIFSAINVLTFSTSIKNIFYFLTVMQQFQSKSPS